MRLLPGFVQPWLTWLTGKPLHDEKPTHHTPIYHLLTALNSLAVGWLMCVFWNEHRLVEGLPLWLLGCLFIVSGARKLQLMIVHQCAHGTFSLNRRINAVIGTFISTALIIEPFESYRYGHLHDHHSKSHMMASDPTVRFLIDLVGLRPGMTVKRLWLVTLCSLISPRFHLRVLSRRCLSQFSHSRTQALLSGLWLVVLTFVAYQTSIGALAFTFLIPLTVAYNISGCLRLCCEHRWPVSPANSVQNRAWYAELSTGIFLGEPFPAGAVWGQFMWALRMLTIHLISRLFVLVGDTPCHDYHHRHPKSPDWPNYTFAREADRRKASAGWPAYTEVWGLFPAISESFKTLSRATISGVQDGD